MGRTLTSIESNNAASERCFILTEPPSIYRISVRLLNFKARKNWNTINLKKPLPYNIHVSKCPKLEHAGQSVVHEIISEQLLIRDIAFNSHVEIIDEIKVNMLYHWSLPFTRCLWDIQSERDIIWSFFLAEISSWTRLPLCEHPRGAL